MSPYKNFLSATKAYFNSVSSLKFLLSSHIYVFALGGLLYVLGVFIPGLYLYDLLTCVGGIIMFAGLILTFIDEDMMALVITSGAISLLSLIAWVVKLFTGYFYLMLFFGPFIYFLIFGAIAIIVAVKSEKFKQMREAAAARPLPGTIICPRCGVAIPPEAGFCPSCGTPKPAPQQYAPPVAQQPYAPPAAPQQYAAPPASQQQYAPPAAQQYTPPVQPEPPKQSVPETPVQPEPPKQSVPEPPVQPEPPQQSAPEPPVQPAASTHCAVCGIELPAGAKFCGKCGAKQ